MPTSGGVFEITLGKNDQGEYIFSVIVKRSYRIEQGGVVERCSEDWPLRKTDAYYDDGDPESSTVQYESELAPFKPMVDIVVIGKAYAPSGEAATEMICTVRVATLEKSITVFGDRECRFREDMSPTFSDPKPFTEMEIRYERAYGGRDETSDPNIPFFYPRNYLGKGVALRNTKKSIDGLALPNLEDPEDCLTPERIVIDEPENWHNQPLPQGFGWFQRTCYPRCAFAGSYPPFLDVDTVTPEERLGLVPKNHIARARQFQLPSYLPRFNNGASQGMLFENIEGGENIRLLGLTPGGDLKFALPTETPEVSLDTGDGAQPLRARLDTVTIRPDDLEIDLIWRAPCVYEGYSWLPSMKRLQAEVH